MTDPVEYLDLEDLIALAADVVGNPPPIRDVGLLGAAASRPRTTVFGEDAYPDLWQKAAALLQSILKNHALVDGNNRLAWLATAVFLEINDVAAIHVDNDAVYEFVMELAAGQDDVERIATRLRSLIAGNGTSPRGPSA